MNRTLTRALALVAAGGLLAACTPPHEKDSEVWVDTATGVAAPTSVVKPTASAAPTADAEASETSSTAASSTALAAGELPGYTNCVGSPEQRPGTISLACGDNNDRLTEITWTEWTPTAATGTATRVTNDCLPNCADGHLVEKPGVKVTLSNPFETLSGTSFTQVAVDGVVVLP